MLHRIIAAVLGVLGIVAVGLAVASATVWRPADVVRASAAAATVSEASTGLLVAGPGVLEMVGDTVTIKAHAPGSQPVVIAIGRDVDVQGWVGSDPYRQVTGLSTWDRLAVRDIEGETEPGTEASASAAPAAPADPAAPAPADAAAPADTAPAEPAAPPANPAGSDLWVAEAVGEGSASLTWTDRPGRWSVLVAAVGQDGAAPAVSFAWPREVTTPWVTRGVVAGVLLVLIALALVTVDVAGWLVARRRKPATAVAPGVAPVGIPVGTVTSAAVARAPDQPMTRRQLREAGGQSSKPVSDQSRPADAPITSSAAAASSAVPTSPTAGEPVTHPAGLTRRAVRAREAQPTPTPPARTASPPPMTSAAPPASPPASPAPGAAALSPHSARSGPAPDSARADAWRRTWGIVQSAPVDQASADATSGASGATAASTGAPGARPGSEPGGSQQASPPPRSQWWRRRRAGDHGGAR